MDLYYQENVKEVHYIVQQKDLQVVDGKIVQINVKKENVVQKYSELVE